MPGFTVTPTLGDLEAQLLSTSLPCDVFGDDTFGFGDTRADVVAVDVVARVVAGDYLGALGVADAKPMLLPYGSDDYPDSFDDYLGRVRAAARAYVDAGGGERDGRAFLTLALGVAALSAFAQANLTGPALEDAAGCPADLHAGEGEGGAPRWDEGALSTLASEANGEDVVGRCRLPQFLALARVLLVEPELPVGEAGDGTLDGTPAEDVAGRPATGAWWAARTLLLHQRLLSSRSAAVRAGALRTTARCLARFAGGAASMVPAAIPAAAALIEAAHGEMAFGHVDAAKALLDRAASALGVSVQVTGAMGMRTAHQVDAKSQLVIKLSRSGPMVEDGGGEPEEGGGEGEGDAEAVDETGERAEGVMMTPRLLDEGERAAQHERASHTEQLLLLALCQHVRQSQADDDLRHVEMAPYVDAVLLQRGAPRPLVKRMCSLFVARSERHRARTRERAFLMMQSLVEQLSASAGHPPAARMRGAYGVGLPLLPLLKKEWGELLVGYGLVGEALPMFQELELWDNLIACLTMLDKGPEAEALCRQRLEASPDDPKLLCSLGDLTRDPSLYERAWEVSGHKHGRSQRSLARAATRLKEWSRAAAHWELALRINPLHSQGWFSMGFAYLQAGDGDERALQAYTRCVQQEPDNGEAWNNIAALSLRKGAASEAYVALGEAVKHKKDSWQTWDNYATAALGTGHPGVAVRAFTKVLQLTNGKGVSVEGLDRLVARLEERAAAGEGVGQLGRQVGDLLKSVAMDSSLPGGKSWGLMARYHGVVGEGGLAHECRLKQVRALQGAKWQKEEPAFVEFAEASLALVAGYEAEGGARALSSARMHLRGVAKGSERAFEDHEMHGRLVGALGRVEAAEKALKEAAEGGE